MRKSEIPVVFLRDSLERRLLQEEFLTKRLRGDFCGRLV